MCRKPWLIILPHLVTVLMYAQTGVTIIPQQMPNEGFNTWRFSEDQTMLVSEPGSFEQGVSGDERNKIGIWDVDSGFLLEHLITQGLTQHSAAFVRKDVIVASVSDGDNSSLVVWDLNQHSIVKTIPLNDRYVGGLALSPDKKTVVCRGQTKLHVIEVSTWLETPKEVEGIAGKQVQENKLQLYKSQGLNYSIPHFSVDGKLVCFSALGDLEVWETTSWTRVFSAGLTSVPTPVFWDDGKYLILSFIQGSVGVISNEFRGWDTQNWSEISQQDLKRLLGGMYKAALLASSNSGEWVLAGVEGSGPDQHRLHLISTRHGEAAKSEFQWKGYPMWGAGLIISPSTQNANASLALLSATTLSKSWTHFQAGTCTASPAPRHRRVWCTWVSSTGFLSRTVQMESSESTMEILSSC